MNAAQMISWAFVQIGRCVASCVAWCNELLESIGGDAVLIFVFFIGAVVTLFIKPIVGFGINAIGADTVNSVYFNYKMDRDITSKIREKDINSYVNNFRRSR